MAHYKGGEAAFMGDVVRGKGYNLGYDITGVVVGITPGSGSCDLHVSTTQPCISTGETRITYPILYEEHGTCAEFELVRRSPAFPRTA